MSHSTQNLSAVIASIPETLKTCLAEIHGKSQANVWLAQLPQLLQQLVRQHELKIFPVAHRLSYNLVLPAELKQEPIILKLCPPCEEFRREVRAVLAYQGHGMAQCIQADLDAGWLLLEKLDDVMLKSWPEPESLKIASQLMQKLHQAPVPRELPHLISWAEGFQRLRQAHKGQTGPFDKSQIERAEHIYLQRAQPSEQDALLHGDLHQMNILRSGQSWRAIDPKGMIGPRAFEPMSFMFNCLPAITQDWPEILRQRVTVFSEALSVPTQSLLEWGFAQSLLSGVWMWEDHGRGWESQSQIAQIFETLMAEAQPQS